jgi:hypothetical protein
MRIRLDRKLADHLDGIDVSRYHEGDVLDLPRADAELLIAERWARPVRPPPHEVREHSAAREYAVVADHPGRRALAQLRRLCDEMDTNRFTQHDGRRVDDRIREELREARSKTIHDSETTHSHDEPRDRLDRNRER